MPKTKKTERPVYPEGMGMEPDPDCVRCGGMGHEPVTVYRHGIDYAVSRRCGCWGVRKIRVEYETPWTKKDSPLLWFRRS